MKDGESSTMNFIHNYLILSRWLNQDDERVGQVACMRKMRYSHKILVRIYEGRRLLGRLCIDGRIILKQILNTMCKCG
jgi:hypothetical protein